MMSTVYTRTGDGGETGLFGGTRLPKWSALVEAYGTIDEANSAIGVAKAHSSDAWLVERLRGIQLRLFVVAAEVASDERGRAILAGTVQDSDVVDLERLIDECLAVTGPQHAFVVPGREPVSAALHVARTVTRRAERRLLALDPSSAPRPEIVQYLNRLSDALYALARVVEVRFDRSRIEDIVRSAVQNLTGSAAPVGPDRHDSLRALDLAAAMSLARAAEHAGARLGVPVVVAVVDDGGNLVVLHRMDGSLLGSLDLAVGKAFTAAAFRQSTAALGPQALDEGPLHGIQASNQGRVVLFGGGEPLVSAGRLVGGIGVSGGTVDEDVLIVTQALSAGWSH